MIDWKSHAINLATVCDRYRRDRMHTDSILLKQLGKDLLELKKLEDKEQDAFHKWHTNMNKPDEKRFRQEYTESVRATNKLSSEIKYN